MYGFYDCVIIVLILVCETVGYLMSYYNRPFFPDACADATLDDSTVFDTMVRISGTYAGYARTFKTIAAEHGWRHLVVVSDDEGNVCFYGARAFEELFGTDGNYTFTWLRFSAEPTDEQLDDILQQIRSRTRGFAVDG